MIKNRLIPCIILKDSVIVQSYFFKRYLPIGNVETAIEFFINWDVDEIILLDIMATRQGRTPNIELIEKVSRNCFVPLTVGGGVGTIEDVRSVIRAGADKVAINTQLIKNPAFVSQVSEKFGNQCIAASIDVRINQNKEYEVYMENGKAPAGLHPVDLAKKAESLGAGEILVNSIDRDGSRKGYDIELMKQVTDAVSIPVIACGGVGKVEHLVEGITEGNVQAVSAANIFQHTEHSTIQAKAYMRKMGIDVRLSSQVNYEDFDFDHMGRAI